MNGFSTIYLKRDIIEQLKDLKVSKSESYNDVLLRLIKYRGFEVNDGMIILKNNTNVEIDKECLSS